MLAAYYLDRAGYEVTLLEEQIHAGGLVRTEATAWGLAESAAHSLVATPAVTGICEALGVQYDEVRKDSRARYVFRDGRMRKFPLTIPETLGMLRRALLTRAPEETSTDLSMEKWGTRYLGTPAVEYLLSPFVRGIYGAEPGELGVRCAFSRLDVPAGKSLARTFLERKKGKPRSRMIAPVRGMGSFVERLERRLEQRLGARFIKGKKIAEIPDSPNVVLSVPAPVAAGILAYADPELAVRLQNVKYSPLISVTAFVKTDFPKPRGVGVLVPAREGRDCLGILFNSSSFPGRVADEESIQSFTVMMGGTTRPELLDASDSEIRELVDRELRAILKINTPPEHVLIHRWPKAVPLYSPELSEIWKLARQGWCATPGRVLFGNYTGQVSIRGMIETATSIG